MSIRSLWLLAVFLILSCGKDFKGQEKLSPKSYLIRDLKIELDSMEKVCLLLSSSDRFKLLPESRWNSLNDSIYVVHKRRINAINIRYGFHQTVPMINSYFKPNNYPNASNTIFSKAIEEKLIKNGLNRRNITSLIDIVRLKIGEKQFYGTQVDYYLNQAIPKPIEDSLNVNKRRLIFRLKPIEKYLDYMTYNHIMKNNENSIFRRGNSLPTNKK